MGSGTAARTVRGGVILRAALLVGGSALALTAVTAPAWGQTNVSAGNAPPAQTGVPPQDNGAVDNSASAAQAGAPKDAPTNPTAGPSNLPTTSAGGNETSTSPSTAGAGNEIVVTGIRGSLQRNLDIKRNSTGIVDAISSEDIGKFPDSNVAQAIQRIPGVSISRGAVSVGGTPTSNGEASEITVRGFGPTFNETLFDDRQIASGVTNRAFDFSAVGADFVGELDVLKTPDASLSAGAIGATINIKYPKPFDHPGPRLAVSGSTTYSPEDGHATPNGGILFSDTFLDNKFGFLADFAYSDHKNRSNHINNQGWIGTTIAPSQLDGAPAGASTASTLNSWQPRDYGQYQEFTDTSREDARFVLQWRPMDNLLVTLNDNYSHQKIRTAQNGYSVWFSSDAFQNVHRDGNGTITSFLQPGEPIDFQSQLNGSVLENNEFGVNVKWDVSENFTVLADFDYAESQLNPDGQLSSIDADVGYNKGNTIGEIVPGGSALPYLVGLGVNGNTNPLYDPAMIGSHVFPIGSQRNTDIVQQGKIQGTWHDDNLQIRIGGQYVTDHDHLRNFDDFGNNDWQAFAGYGPFGTLGTGVALPASFFTHSYSSSNFLPGQSGANNLPAQVLKYDPYQVLNYLQSLGNPQTQTVPGFANSGSYNGTYRIAEELGSHQDITNSTWSGYVSVSEKTHLAQFPLQINFGLREEVTRSTSAGIGQQPVALVQQAGDPTALQVIYSDGSVPIRKSFTYSNLLPNIDLNLSLTDKIKVRVDASRTLTRPPLADLSPVLNVGASQRTTGLTASGNNPLLQPFLADNFDLGVEWYYARNSYISIDGFLKHVTNFIVAGSSQQNINGVINPVTGQPAVFSVNGYVNGPAATIRGLEIAVQHVFGDTGFGLQANATVVGSDHSYNPNDLTISGFAVTGLADSANLVAFYDKHGFQARVAVNWRDAYLDHFGQAQSSGLFGVEPTFVDSNTTVDFSSSYDLTKQLSVYFEALNLSDSGFFTRGRFSNQFLDGVSYGRRFTLGAHFRY